MRAKLLSQKFPNLKRPAVCNLSNEDNKVCVPLTLYEYDEGVTMYKIIELLYKASQRTTPLQ